MYNDKENFSFQIKEGEWHGYGVILEDKGGVSISLFKADSEEVYIYGDRFRYYKTDEHGKWVLVGPEELCEMWGVPRKGVDFEDEDECVEKYGDYNGVSEGDVRSGYNDDYGYFKMNPTMLNAILKGFTPTRI